MAAPFLTSQFPTGTITVQAAWGADLTAVYTTWTWTDITADVRINDGIHLKHGRGDESDFANPATCSLTLNNSTGAYSLGGQSPNWPNVVKNTPIRVRVDLGTGSGVRTLFVGYADSWQPVWNQAATMADVQLTASGILRRMMQHTAPVRSSLTRRLSTEPDVVAYWPLEEGKRSNTGASAFDGYPEMVAGGIVEFGGNDDQFVATERIAMLKPGALSGIVPPYTSSTGKIQVRALISIPDNGTGMTNLAPLLRVWLGNASMDRFEVVYVTGSGGMLRADAYKPNGTGATQILTGTPITFAVNGTESRYFIELTQNGANVDWRIGVQFQGGSATFGSGTLAAVTLGAVVRVQVCPDGIHNGVGVGQVVAYKNITSIFDDDAELGAWDGESTPSRFGRLLDENGIEHVAIGDGTAMDSVTDKLGYQGTESLLTLIKEIQDLDRGIIYDGHVDGLGGLKFTTRRGIENQEPSLTVNVAAKQLAGPLQPIDDDQALLNRAVVTRNQGATATFEDVTGPLGTDSVGTYDSSLTISTASDDAPYLLAGWLVGLGTVEGYRYPSIEIDVATAPTHGIALSLLSPGDRIDLTNIAGVIPQHPARDVALLVQGYEQTLTPWSWRFTINCTPFDPWSLGRLTDPSGVVPADGGGDIPGDEVLWLDTDGSQLASAAALGATSLSVATTSGPLWTTTAQDFPLDIEVGGIVVTVTAVSGSTSPQTFTVTGVTKALASGLDVRLHSPNRLGL